MICIGRSNGEKEDTYHGRKRAREKKESHLTGTDVGWWLSAAESSCTASRRDDRGMPMGRPGLGTEQYIGTYLLAYLLLSYKLRGAGPWPPSGAERPGPLFLSCSMPKRLPKESFVRGLS